MASISNHHNSPSPLLERGLGGEVTFSPPYVWGGAGGGVYHTSPHLTAIPSPLHITLAHKSVTVVTDSNNTYITLTYRPHVLNLARHIASPRLLERGRGGEVSLPLPHCDGEGVRG